MLGLEKKQAKLDKKSLPVPCSKMSQQKEINIPNYYI